MSSPTLAYLYSRYPVVSQTFCDSEMLALEGMGYHLSVASLYPPKDSFRHERLASLRAPIHYPPPPAILKALQTAAEHDGSWPGDMVARHDQQYGPSFQSAVRARNALWFARVFQRLGINHVHVHFANRATHTALFIKAITGIPFSFTPHAQDFMVDLGSDMLLAEMCREAVAVIAVSDFSLGLLREKCPESAGHMHRVYNGLAVDAFPAATIAPGGPLRVVSIGRLIPFKGFIHLIDAVAGLNKSGTPATLRIIGDGPLRAELHARITAAGVEDSITLLGPLSQQAIKAELACADVFALASVIDDKGASDILPTVIAEAMACGLPVVSTRLAGIPEMVDHGVTGLLADPGDVTALATHLGALHDDRGLARQLGAAGRVRATGKFSLATTAESLASLLVAANPSLAAHPPPSPVSLWLLPTWPVAPDLHAELAWSRGLSRAPAYLALATGENPGGDSAGVDFLPDGIVLEAAWRANPAHAARCEAIRHELGGACDGEMFFQLARRAVWLAEECPKRGVNTLHGARAGSTLLAWLTAELTGLPFSGVLEPAHAIDGKWVRRLQAAATALIDSKQADVLCLAAPAPVIRRLGPIKWKQAAGEPSPAKQRDATLDKLFRRDDHPAG